MSLKDALIEHANVLRSKTGVSDTLSISDMTRLLGDLSWNKKNLLKGTSDEYRTLGNVAHEDWVTVTTSDNLPLDISDNGYKSVTYSATLCNLSKFNVQGEIIFLDINNNRLYDNVSNKVTPWIYPGEMDKELSVTRVVPADVKKIQVDFCAFTYKNPCPIKMKNERLYEGTEPGIWTPNPSDLTGGGRISHSASVMLPNHFNRLEVKVA